MSLIDPRVTNFENGINNRVQGANIFGSMKQLDPTRFHNFWDDFDTYSVDDTTGAPFNWTISGTNAVVTNVELNSGGGDGGFLSALTGALENDQILLSTIEPSFTTEVNKPFYFAIRLSIDDVLQSDLIAGIQSVPGLTPVEGIFFRKLDGSATVDLVAAQASVEAVLSSVTTLTNDTMVELAYYWDGVNSIWAGVNGAPVARFEPGVSLPDGDLISLTFGLQAGEAAQKSLLVDYIFASKER